MALKIPASIEYIIRKMLGQYDVDAGAGFASLENTGKLPSSQSPDIEVASSAPTGNITIGISDAEMHLITPTANISATLNNTFLAGGRVKILNGSSTVTITVKANDGGVIGTLSPGGFIELVSKAAAPGSKTSWYVQSRSTKREEILSGSGNWTVPEGVYKIHVVMCGGGGGGGGGYGAAHTGSGGGGGGGAIREAVLDVTPGNSLSYSVGVGGAGGAVDTNGADGGDTTFSTLTAPGGGGGGKGASGVAGASGAGGGWGTGNTGGKGGAGKTVTGIAGTGGESTEYANGGSGGASGSYCAGGGGGAAFGVGANGASQAVAPAPSAAANTGGGGGGGRTDNNEAGGNGGSGKIILIY